MKRFDAYIHESLVNTDATPSGDFLSMLRGALADEQSATNLYDRILPFAKDDEAREIIGEIRQDEKNHTGKLLYLIKKYDPEFGKTEQGMLNKE